MVTIAHLVKKYIDSMPFLQEAMSREIISYGNLSDELQPSIEKEMGKKVKTSAVIMALRRYAESLKFTKKKEKFDFSSEIIMKTGLIDIAVLKSQKLFNLLDKLYRIVDYEKGEILNIIQGTNEVAVITNNKYEKKVIDILKDEKIINVEKNLVSISMSYSREFIHTPGIIFAVVRKLSWENINIYEIVSTFTELTFIIHKKDLTKAYNMLSDVVNC